MKLTRYIRLIPMFVRKACWPFDQEMAVSRSKSGREEVYVDGKL